MIPNVIDQKLQTPKGMINISDLNNGDKLFEYSSRSLLNVEKVVLSDNKKDIYEFEFNDGRKMLVPEKELMCFNNHLLSIKEIINAQDSLPILKPKQFDYSESEICTAQKPDPYITGALLINSDFDDNYVNIPLDKTGASNFFRSKYGTGYVPYVNKGKTYFNIIGTKRLLSWREFYAYYKIYVSSKDFNDSIILNEYLFGSINDRWQFVRGAFDVGYDPKVFPNTISIAHKYEERLKEFQKVLWSLGILSKIYYDPNMYQNSNKVYRLDVISSYENYPGLFYDINTIKSILNSDNIMKHSEEFIFRVKRINFVGKAQVYSVFTDKHLSIASTDNYLPYVIL